MSESDFNGGCHITTTGEPDSYQQLHTVKTLLRFVFCLVFSYLFVYLHTSKRYNF